jgi:hypothetical protein
LQLLVSSDRKRMIYIYTAPDAESVRLAHRKARQPLDSVWVSSPFIETAARV